MKPKQITTLKHEQKQLEDADAARRAFAVLLLVTHGDIELSGYTKDHAKRLKSQYLRYGIDVFRDKRQSSHNRILTTQERATVIQTLETKQPKDVITGCSDEHWSTYRLSEYVLTLTGKRYKSKTSQYVLFKEAKLSFHLPGKLYERSDPAVKAAWADDTKPILEQYWQEPDTVILCEDEMVLTNATTLQKVWLPRGEYPPVLEINTTKKRQSFYGFLNLKTGRQHTFVTDKQNMLVTTEVLTEVRALYPSQKLVLFWDNAGWHRGSKVIEWIEQDGNTETMHFPPYTPDFNPQEHV